MVVDDRIERCPDGTPFPVVWEEPDDAERHWRWNGSHFPLPLKPLTVALVTAPGARAAARRPFDEVGLEAPSVFAFQRYLHGFQYVCYDNLPGPAYQRANAGAISALVAVHGNPIGVWQLGCLPRIETLLAGVRADDGTTPLAVLAEAAVEAMNLTQVAGAIAGSVTVPLLQACMELFGPEGEAFAWELTHGGDNLTRDADQALWDLAHLAERDASVRALVTGDGIDLAALRGRPEAAAFVAALDAYLERYGERVESWGYDTPTLREQPERLYDLVRRTIVEQRPSPASRVQQATERREALAADLRARLAGQSEALARFNAALANVTPYVTIREDRAYWQLLASGVMRTAILGRGRRLAADGLLADAEDIYFLLPDEVENVEALGVVSGELAEAIETRRREWLRWAGVTPPETLGPVEEIGPAVDAVSGDEAAPAGALVLRGIAASRGVATGRACVATSLEDAERLEPGQVLVCVMTAPPWTPHFGIAAAIVTDTGNTIAHSAIAAREYGIPAVVGTSTATRDIPNGATVTVDGTSGIVQIESPTGASSVLMNREGR